MAQVIYLDSCVWSSMAQSDPHWARARDAAEQAAWAGAAKFPVSLPMALELAQWVRIDGSNARDAIEPQLQLMADLSRGWVFRNNIRKTEPTCFRDYTTFRSTFLSNDWRAMFWCDGTAGAVADAIVRLSHYSELSVTPAGGLFSALAVMCGVVDKHDAIRQSFIERAERLAAQVADPAHLEVDGTRPPRLKRIDTVHATTLKVYSERERDVTAKRNSGDGCDIEHRAYAVNCETACLDRASAELLRMACGEVRVFDTTPAGTAAFTAYVEQFRSN